MTTLVESNSITSEPIAGADHATDREWDAFVVSNHHGHHEQSSMYGQLRKAYGYDCCPVIVQCNNKIVGGAQILSQTTPIGRLAVVKRGPLAVDDDPEVLHTIIGEIESAARQRRIASLRIETLVPQMTLRSVLEKSGFQSSKSWGGRMAAARIRLDGTDDELLARMTQKGRYNIRLAMRCDVEIRVGDVCPMDDFYHLHKMTAEHQHFPIFPIEYYDYLWRTFGAAGRVQYFVAYYNDRPIATAFNTLVGQHMLYGWGGIHRGDHERKLMAGYLLHFRAMGWARDHGCTHYDLGRIAETSRPGITQFKTRIAPVRFHWPVPMRKYYGPLRALRPVASDFAWSNSLLRRSVNHIARRLGLSPKMPW